MPTQQTRVRDVPHSDTIFTFLKARTGYRRAVSAVRSPLADAGRLEFELAGVDVDKLLACIVDVMSAKGFQGWRHSGGQSASYGGFSLTWNPDHQDSADPDVSSIGTERNARSEFFWSAVQHHEQLKHSYFDTYGFRVRTPMSRAGYLGEFLDSFRANMVRSRVGIIPAGIAEPSTKSYQENEGWHRDEPIFENLRINIPLQTDENYLFQMENEEPYHLEVGKAYTWDTNRPHRVFARQQTGTTRIHLVLGFSPWYDYSEREDSWVANEFHGKVHPFDMLASGQFSRHLRFLGAN